MPANPTAYAPDEVALPADRSGQDAPDCEDEPIRIPGSIQRHGFLLLLDAASEIVVGASENSEEFLNVPVSLLLGSPIEAVLEREILGALRTLVAAAGAQKTQIYLGSFVLRDRFYSIVTHCVGQERVVEFEVVDRLVNPELSNLVFTNFVTQLSQLRTELELCQALTRSIADLTKFSRVMLYRFDEAGHGTVLCEENDGTLPRYLGLRFPASDIPRQARELYVLNTTRIIPDVSYVPSPLVGLRGRGMGGFDLSLSTLRSVSPIHLEYMRNMGTLSSMSVSIVSEGRLWGLISGHHAEPLMVPYLVRSACDLLTKLVSTQLLSFRAAHSLNKMAEFHAVQRRMLTRMAAENNYLVAMADEMEDLLHITGGEGVALVIDGESHVFGRTPHPEHVNLLAGWMDARPDLEIFETGNLSSHLKIEQGLEDIASGLLVIRISHIRQSYVMWFRPEVVRTVQWAGEPVKRVERDQTLHPRSSFAIWKEQVRGTSDPWSPMEIKSASDFRRAVMTISLKRAEEAVHLGESRFLQLTHALPHPVWTANDEGWLTYVNQRWLDHGFRHQGAWFEQERIAPEDQRNCSDLWEKAVLNAAPFSFEVRFRSSADGPERWNLVQAIPYLRVNGLRAGWVGTCTDLTDRRQREAALQMTEKLALTGRMTSVIAHEINNPLEAITNLLYLLGESVRGDAEARTFISLAETELQRISAITRQTLRWARETTQEPETTHVATLIKDVLRIYAGKIRNREVEVVVDGGEEVCVYGILGQLSQVLANLLANAVHAVKVGGRIWLRFHQDGDHVEIAVRDNGHGMTEETLQNLFQPFYSTKGDLGNGLGLYISHEIIERHHGRLTVTSILGEGTEIRMRLPTVARAPQPPTPAAT